MRQQPLPELTEEEKELENEAGGTDASLMEARKPPTDLECACALMDGAAAAASTMLSKHLELLKK